MPSKLQMYEQMADQTAKQVTGSFGEWTAFLETMGRLYKYPFHEQLMIFAQKPNATACADYDLWNKQMGRYVRRGTKGIALIDWSVSRAWWNSVIVCRNSLVSRWTDIPRTRLSGRHKEN